jgi:hypothetical protein
MHLQLFYDIIFTSESRRHELGLIGKKYNVIGPRRSNYLLELKGGIIFCLYFTLQFYHRFYSRY